MKTWLYSIILVIQPRSKTSICCLCQHIWDVGRPPRRPAATKQLHPNWLLLLASNKMVRSLKSKNSSLSLTLPSDLSIARAARAAWSSLPRPPYAAPSPLESIPLLLRLLLLSERRKFPTPGVDDASELSKKAVKPPETPRSTSHSSDRQIIEDFETELDNTNHDYSFARAQFRLTTTIWKP